MEEIRKRGRPKGSRNAPNPVKDAVRTAIPAKIPRKRAPQEAFQGTKYISSLPLDAVSHACLMIHARRRMIPMAWLIQDVLNLWLAASTDYGQAIFRDQLPHNARAAKCPERYPGYIEGLGFVEAPQTPVAPPATPAPVQDVYVPSPATVPTWQAHTPTEKTLTDLTRPYQHPMTQGPASYPHPTPGLPQGSNLFDPQRHKDAATTPGIGNAAQQAVEGGLPEPSQAPLPRQVEEFIDHYRVKPEDIR